ncbi:MAG TPA: replication-relaxation family protein, partial [Verrucomicrobiae bacterium]
MPPPRLPRFRRATVRPIQLTGRDLDILRCIHWHRFLRSSHIVELAGGSVQQVLRRLQHLYHGGFLERPRCQLDWYYQQGSRQIVYGLADKGAERLRDLGTELGKRF